jgi:hypothetical protein
MNNESPTGTASTAALHRPSINLTLGKLVSTPGAIEAMARVGQEPLELLNRHRSGDWGEVDAEDWATNDHAVIHGERVLSAYTLKDGVLLWIITEADRSATTFLLPEEY